MQLFTSSLILFKETQSTIFNMSVTDETISGNEYYGRQDDDGESMMVVVTVMRIVVLTSKLCVWQCMVVILHRVAMSVLLN